MADASSEAVKGEDEHSQNAHSSAKMKESRMNKPIAETIKLLKPQVIKSFKTKRQTLTSGKFFDLRLWWIFSLRWTRCWRNYQGSFHRQALWALSVIETHGYFVF
jgi:hypothetical protein